jgi:hypothetical protein
VSIRGKPPLLCYSAAEVPYDASDFLNLQVASVTKVIEILTAALRMEYGMKHKEKGSPSLGEYESLHAYLTALGVCSGCIRSSSKVYTLIMKCA